MILQKKIKHLCLQISLNMYKSIYHIKVETNKSSVSNRWTSPLQKRGRIPNYSDAVEIILILHLSRSTFVCRKQVFIKRR